MSGKMWIAVGSLFGGLSVAMGAFGAHGLKDTLTPEYLEVYKTGAEYQMYHALALIAAGIVLELRPGIAAKVAAFAFLIGIFLFSGSLYALTITGIRVLGAITPFGGVSFMVGWAALAWHAFRASKAS